MLANRSIPPATVILVLVHPDVAEAVDWLCAAFGSVNASASAPTGPSS